MEAYPLGTRRTFRKSVYGNDKETMLTCQLFHAEKHALFVGTSDGSVMVWKPKSDYKVDVLKTLLGKHGGAVHQFQYIPELASGLLLSCSADRTVKVWDPWDRDLKNKCVQTLSGHGGTVTSVAYVKGMLISVSTDETIRVWSSDPSRGLLLYPWFITQQIIQPGADSVLKACPTSVGVLRRSEAVGVYIGDEKGRVYSFNPPFPAKPGTLLVPGRPPQKLHSLSITKLVLVPTESFMITLSFDNTAQVHDALTGNGFFAIENPMRCRYTDAAWDVHNQELILCDVMGHVQVWNIYVEKCVKSHQLLEEPLVGLDLLDRGQRLMAGTRFGVEVWTLQRDAEFREYTGHESAIVKMVHVGLKERNLYTASHKTIRCWDCYDMSCLGVLKQRQSEISCLLYLPGSIIIITGHDDGSIKLWNIDSGSSMALEQHKNTVSCLAIAHTAKQDLLISGSYDNTIALWDISKRRVFNPFPECSITVSSEEVLCVCFDSTHETIITGGNDKLVQIWNLGSQELVAQLKGHKEAVTCLVQDANFIISGSDDHTIKIWDCRFHFLVKTLDEHHLAVRELMVVQGGSLVSCSFDGQILVWDYVSGAVVKRYTHKNDFRCLLYSPIDNQILAGTEQCNIMTFTFPPELLKEPPTFQAIVKGLDAANKQLFEKVKENEANGR